MQLKFLVEIRYFRIAQCPRGVTLGSHIDIILHTESRFRGSKVQPLGRGIRYGSHQSRWTRLMAPPSPHTKSSLYPLAIADQHERAHLQTPISPLKSNPVKYDSPNL